MLRLLNRSEEIVFDEITAIGQRFGLAAYPKVRLADVIDLDTLPIDYAHKSFGLRSHFDFVIYRDYIPQYAVEFDGPSHFTERQKERDQKKDHLCDLSRLPILRINSRHLTKDFGKITLLSWIIETYEMQSGFYEAQENGQIPWDEPFDPFTLMTLIDGKFEHPLWLSQSSRRQMHELYRKGLIHNMGSSGWIGENARGVMRGIEFIGVTPTHGLHVETAMRSQQFPIVFSDLLNEILTIHLMKRITEHLAGGIQLEPMVLIHQRIRELTANYRLLCSHSIGSPTAASMDET